MSQPTRSPQIVAQHRCVDGECADFRPGHSVSPIQLRIASATASKWSDAIVASVEDDGWVRLTTVDDNVTARVWHHADLSHLVRVGDPVALHATYHVLAVGSARLNVAAA